MPMSRTRFWEWYERHRQTQTVVVALLFLWQLSHLYWLTTAVVVPRLTGIYLSDPSPALQFFLAIADYVEIPALFSATLLYASNLRKQPRFKDALFLVLVNSQWLHLLWITDEFVVEQFTGTRIGITGSLAWLAIAIDYLEVPVIIDTVYMVVASWFKRIRSNTAPSIHQ